MNKNDERYGGGEEASPLVMGGRAFQEGNSKCKGPEVSVWLCVQGHKASHKAGRSECRVCSRR